jgi:hypothetical protein
VQFLKATLLQHPELLHVHARLRPPVEAFPVGCSTVSSIKKGESSETNGEQKGK